MLDLNRAEAAMMADALRSEAKQLRQLMNDLERRGLHNGDQNVEMGKRINALEALYNKVVASMIN